MMLKQGGIDQQPMEQAQYSQVPVSEKNNTQTNNIAKDLLPVRLSLSRRYIRVTTLLRHSFFSLFPLGKLKELEYTCHNQNKTPYKMQKELLNKTAHQGKPIKNFTKTFCTKQIV
jgi:hypothetical protein